MKYKMDYTNLSNVSSSKISTEKTENLSNLNLESPKMSEFETCLSSPFLMPIGPVNFEG